jgi:hypothetical protein
VWFVSISKSLTNKTISHWQFQRQHHWLLNWYPLLHWWYPLLLPNLHPLLISVSESLTNKPRSHWQPVPAAASSASPLVPSPPLVVPSPTAQPPSSPDLTPPLCRSTNFTSDSDKRSSAKTRGALSRSFLELFECSEPSTRIPMPLNVSQSPKFFFILVVAIYDLRIVCSTAFDRDNLKGLYFARVAV